MTHKRRLCASQLTLRNLVIPAANHDARTRSTRAAPRLFRVPLCSMSSFESYERDGTSQETRMLVVPLLREELVPLRRCNAVDRGIQALAIDNCQGKYPYNRLFTNFPFHFRQICSRAGGGDDDDNVGLVCFPTSSLSQLFLTFVYPAVVDRLVVAPRISPPGICRVASPYPSTSLTPWFFLPILY